jgi:hypothetical protein
MSIWLLRIVWASLPVTAGPAAARALDDWSVGPQLAAAILLWTAWAVVLASVLAPRPPGLTALRVAAPVFFVLAIAAAVGGDAPFATAWGAVLATGVALVLAASSAVSVAAANGVAYGDERRFPLKTPPALLLGPLPLAPLVVGAGLSVGPLLLAAGRPVAGGVALAIGLPVAAFMARALHGLSRRWAVLVPAGLALADPLTLPDPVLFLRERIVALRPADPRAPVPPGTLDLRLGAVADSVALVLDRETEFLYTRRGVRGVAEAKSTELRFAAVRSNELLAIAAERRIRVG